MKKYKNRQEYIKKVKEQIRVVQDTLNSLLFFKGYHRDKFNDESVRMALEWDAHIICDSTGVLAMIITNRKDRMEAFSVLGSQGIISLKLMEKLYDLIKIDDLLMINFYKMDFNIIYNFFKKGYKNVEKFTKEAVKIVNAWLFW